MDVKQVIVVRKDLNMRKGKLAAQVAHASMKVITDLMPERLVIEDVCSSPNIVAPPYSNFTLNLHRKSAMYEWLTGSFTKIVVGVNSEKELMDLYVDVQLAGLPHALILDAGKTEFHGQETYTCLAIGPTKDEDIDKITGGLVLL